jgi:hypothetical protein
MQKGGQDDTDTPPAAVSRPPARIAMSGHVLLLVMAWGQAAMDPVHRQLVKHLTRRPKDPKPFPGLMKKPTGVDCERAQAPMVPPLAVPPPLIVATRGRP